ncbi:MAG: hypothetical protein ABW352_15255 [Polyangiales bacterium]
MDRRSFALFALMFACSDDGGGEPMAPPTAEPTPDAGAPTPPDAAISSPCAAGEISCDDTCISAIAPTAEAVTTRIFKTSCGFASSCHGGTSPKQGLALDTVDNLIATAVSKTSTQATDKLIVSPAQAERSYLIDKLLGQNLAMSSEVMPQPPLERLCAAKVEVVRAWINAGAPR